jgi:hypothetical protein
LCAFLLAKLDASRTKTLSYRQVRETVKFLVESKGRTINAKEGLPSLNWLNLFLQEYKAFLSRPTAGTVQRVSISRRIANNAATRSNHFEIYNGLFKMYNSNEELIQILGSGNIDESSLADSSQASKTEKRGLKNRITLSGTVRIYNLIT